MTCIIGIATGTRGIIVCDQQATASDWRKGERADRKAFAIGQSDSAKAWGVAGFCGSYRYGQIIRHHVAVQDVEPDDLYEWAVVEYVPAIRAALREHGALKVDQGVDDGHCLLVATRTALVCIESDFQVAAPFGPIYHAVGSGSDVALGYLDACRDRNSNSPSFFAAAAIIAASRRNAAVGSIPYEISVGDDA